MARNRNISPNLWGNDQVQDLSWGAAFLYVGCISMADDAGRLRWSAKSIANFAVGRRQDISNDDVERWMNEIQASGLIAVYEIDGRWIGQHPNWEVYQYVNRPQKSNLPLPDGTYETEPRRRLNSRKPSPDSVSTHQPETEFSNPDHGAITERSRSDQVIPRERSVLSMCPRIRIRIRIRYWIRYWIRIRRR